MPSPSRTLAAPPSRFTFLTLLGPGILVAATGVGAGDLATGGFAGSKLGPAVLWAVACGALLKYVLTEGLTRWQLATGETLWHYQAERGCHIPEENKPLVGLQNMRAGKKIDLETMYSCSFYYGLSAALTSTEELVFSAGLDGKVRAFDIANGQVLWQAETAKPFDASNGIRGHGGAIDVSGQVMADGWLYVQSGYSMFGQLPGNMLLAYRVGSASR